MPDTTPDNLSRSNPANIEVIDLGRLGYRPAFERQQQRNQAVIDGEAAQAIFTVEHDPVITISHRKSAADHLVASPDLLEQLGIDVCETNRGGDITYHGPGQLVVYPILRLADHGLNLSSYMRLLEQIVIDTLATWNIQAHRDPEATGVWVLEAELPGATSGEKLLGAGAKVCALGVRVRKNVTLHGLALNITTNLDHFKTIVPCGLVGRPVTSMAQLLGERCPSFTQVRQRLVEVMLASLDQPGD